MAVSIKSEREIELMREAGKLLAKTHLELEKELHPDSKRETLSAWTRD